MRCAAILALCVVLASAGDAFADRKKLVVVVAKGSSITSISTSGSQALLLG